LKSDITDLNVLAKELGRKPLAIERKLQRMGVVVGERKFQKQQLGFQPLSFAQQKSIV